MIWLDQNEHYNNNQFFIKGSTLFHQNIYISFSNSSIMKNTIKKLKRGKNEMNKIVISIVMAMLLFGSFVIAQEIPVNDAPMERGGEGSGYGYKAIEIISDEEYQSLKSEEYKINEIFIAYEPETGKPLLYLDASHETYLGLHMLVAPESWIKSDPARKNVKLIVRGNDIPEGYRRQISFDLSPIINQYQKQYGECKSIIINFEDYEGKINELDLVCGANNPGGEPPREEPKEKPIFEGEGFLINDEEKAGVLFYITLYQDGEELSGYLTSLSGDSQPIKGEINGDKVKFSVADENLFEGTIQEYRGGISAFILLKGILYVNEEEQIFEGQLYAIDKGIYKKIKVGEEFSVGVPTNSDDITNVIPDSVAPQTDESETAVTATVSAIKPSNFLGILPKFWSDDKSVVVEFKEGEETSTITINERTSKEIGDYLIEVGEVESESDIEISVSRKG